MHFKKVCENCEKVIEQCRCPGDKTIQYGICDKCKEKGNFLKTDLTEKYEEALRVIAECEGMTLLGCGEEDCNMFPHCPEVERRAHQIGANKAFNQVAAIAKAALHK